MTAHTPITPAKVSPIGIGDGRTAKERWDALVAMPQPAVWTHEPHFTLTDEQYDFILDIKNEGSRDYWLEQFVRDFDCGEYDRQNPVGTAQLRISMSKYTWWAKEWRKDIATHMSRAQSAMDAKAKERRRLAEIDRADSFDRVTDMMAEGA